MFTKSKEVVLESIYDLSKRYQETNDISIIKEIINISLTENYFDMYQKYFLGCQIKSWMFMFNTSIDREYKVLMHKLLKNVTDDFYKLVKESMVYTPNESRCKNLVVVITSQLLNVYHSTSRFIMDMCYELRENMGFKVLLINTADVITTKGKIPLSCVYKSNYVDFSRISEIDYKGTKIFLFQSSKQMPDVDEINNMCQYISELKPYFIIQYGGFNLFAELANKLVPVITYNTISKDFPLANTTFLALTDRVLQNKDFKFLRKIDKNVENILENADTPMVLANENSVRTYTRKEFDLPEEKFILLIAGTRLDVDIKADFIDMLIDVLSFNKNIFITFVGSFSKYDILCKEKNIFINNSKYLGPQRDIFNILNLFDLYINPDREGNGSIAHSAASQKVPIVTFPNNDVAAVISNNKDFIFTSYTEMKKEIIKYSVDKSYHKVKSEKIAIIAKEYLAKNNFKKTILEDVIKRKNFY